MEDQVTYLSSQLTDDDAEDIKRVLLRYSDLFAWTAADMAGIDPSFHYHRLSVCRDAKPIAQKKRKIGGERSQAVKEEMTKLLHVGFIREVKYSTWLANVVMVKKANGKWRMCTDYTDLNKACPKDAYPLPYIDALVDGAAGHHMLSFLDAYSGYNQIPMYPPDEAKTAFITDSANFCYRVMPFGLRNAGATYQRLMDKIFRRQIGTCLEVYVDDMVIKSTSVGDHLKDLNTIFEEVRRHHMRLNPAKCTFGVAGGKFLGFMLSKRGIEANPDKCQAIINMKSPRNIKEVQRLAGRIASLARFLPCMAEKSKPIMFLLKKATKF
uniref:Transposon Ty3-G Gag-Pol polyprotein n=1 Tax=Cajanus cajan TaxID=3821 RepID=A0A151THC6_CAJCA|nr:Transposon Ty3-G Gag-Pol polyprotein [Cajanus cajan]